VNRWVPVPVCSPAQLKQILDTGEPVELIDVREPAEWNISNLGEFGARLIPLQELPQRLGEIDADANIIVYCRSGSRSEMAARFMLGNGFESVTNLDGGINAWAREIDPAMPTY